MRWFQPLKLLLRLHSHWFHVDLLVIEEDLVSMWLEACLCWLVVVIIVDFFGGKHVSHLVWVLCWLLIDKSQLARLNAVLAVDWGFGLIGASCRCDSSRHVCLLFGGVCRSHLDYCGSVWREVMERARFRWLLRQRNAVSQGIDFWGGQSMGIALLWLLRLVVFQ